MTTGRTRARAPREKCSECGRLKPSVAGPRNKWGTTRDACGLSLRQVAARAGVSASTIQRIEDGHDVALSRALAVAAAYGVRVEDMCEETP